MGIFSFLRRWVWQRSAPRIATVSFDDVSVTCRRPSGLAESVKWAELRAVLIETTDAGPAVDDVFWILVGGGTGCVVPSEAEGLGPLLEKLQQLPGFDNNAVIEAMSSAENRQFLCWKRQDVTELS